MITRTPDSVLLSYLQDSLKILNQGLSWSRQGINPGYRVVAAQLRLLLCDTTRIHGRIVDVSLAPRLIPDLCLHPVVQSGGQIEIDREGLPLSRLEWLGQTIELAGEGGRKWSLRDIIRRVCDRDGGVHVDPQPVPDELPALALAGPVLVIGNYIYEELSSMI